MFKESGSLEEDENVVLGIYNYFRESETNKEAQLQKERTAQKKAKAKEEVLESQPITEADFPQDVGISRAQYVDVIVLKNREGATNQTVKFLYKSAPRIGRANSLNVFLTGALLPDFSLSSFFNIYIIFLTLHG